MGMMLGPLALVSIYYSRKKGKKSPWIAFLFLGLFLAGCSLCPSEPLGMQVGEAETNPFETVVPTESETVQPPSTAPAPTESPTGAESSCDYCSAWAGGQGVYNADEAVRFARDNSSKLEFQKNGYKLYEGNGNTNCTNFISYALLAGGLLQGDVWYQDSGAWIRTNELYTYLINNAGFTASVEFVSSGNYYFTTQLNSSEKLKEGEDKFLPLRLNSQSTRNTRQSLDNGDRLWVDYLNQIGNTKAGDLVFYKNYIDWSHVGIVTQDSAAPTNYSFPAGLEPDANEPQIIDHDGITDSVPRSIGDTSSFQNYKVVILHGP